MSSISYCSYIVRPVWRCYAHMSTSVLLLLLGDMGTGRAGRGQEGKHTQGRAPPQPKRPEKKTFPEYSSLQELLTAVRLNWVGWARTGLVGVCNQISSCLYSLCYLFVCLLVWLNWVDWARTGWSLQSDLILFILSCKYCLCYLFVCLNWVG